MPFYIFGAIGIIWAIVLAFFMKDVKQETTDNTQKASFMEAFKVVCSRPSALMLAIVFGILVYVDVGIKTWMPTYVSETFFDNNLSSANFNFVMCLYSGAFIGVMIGSRICDKLYVKIRHIRFSLNMVAFLLSAPFLFLAVNTDTLMMCKLSLITYGICKGMYDSCMFASILDVVPMRYRASGMGIMICGGFFIGSTSSTILGLIRDHFSLTVGISSLSLFSILNAVVLLIIIVFFFKRDSETI